ncbi:MAG: T9SS type A sorting domain-containing protein [Flavobacteriaceae bacterium]|nr:T9SS type A sorting domain-containing protein [Candidatus Onthonaster equi]
MKHILLFLSLTIFAFSNVQAQHSVGYNMEQSNTSVYPNPASSQVSVKFQQPNKVAYIAVYSIIGNEVINKKVDQSANFKLNIQTLKKGKYIIRVFNVDGTTESLSLIKN